MKYLFLTFITGLTAFSTFSEFHSHSSGKDTFKGEKEIHFTANDFHDSVLLEGVPLGLSSYIGKHPRNIEVIEGKYLIFDTYKNEHHGHLYDIETHEVRHLGPNGQDAGKILSMNKFDVNSATGKIYAFDFKKDEIVTYSLKNMFEGDSLNFEKVTKLSGFETPLYPQVGAQNEIWSLSLTDPNARIFVCDTSGSLVKRIGNLPKRKGRFEKKDRLYAQVHQGIFSISPNKQWAATANFYNDYVQVFQHDTLAFTLRGPEKISTIWKPVKLYGNFQFVITGKTKQTYVGVDAEDDALYLLYSGKSESEAPSDFPQPGWYRALTNEIFVFGWDGSPVKRIVLDRNIIAFCVDSPNKMLYAIDFLSSDIIAYSLP